MKCAVKLYVAGRVFTEEVEAKDYADARETALARNPKATVISVNAVFTWLVGDMKETIDRIETTIKNTTTDVINRLHLLDGEDRYFFLLEHLETLCYSFNEDDLLWLEYKQYEKKENNDSQQLSLFPWFNFGF